jgi:hypothetical protein
MEISVSKSDLVRELGLTQGRNVKRWREGDQIERWVGSGLLVAEQQFRKVIGYRQIPLLLSAMANAVSQKPVARKAAIA